MQEQPQGRLTGSTLIAHLVHACQERVAVYHTAGCAAEQRGETELAERWYRASRIENALLQQYWRMGAEQHIELANAQASRPEGYS